MTRRRFLLSMLFLAAAIGLGDPPALAEAWYVRQNYLKVSDADKSLRIRYWNCGENPNNSVFQTKDGTTQFKNLNFDTKDNKEKAKP